MSNFVVVAHLPLATADTEAKDFPILPAEWCIMTSKKSAEAKALRWATEYSHVAVHEIGEPVAFG